MSFGCFVMDEILYSVPRPRLAIRSGPDIHEDPRDVTRRDHRTRSDLPVKAVARCHMKAEARPQAVGEVIVLCWNLNIRGGDLIAWHCMLLMVLVEHGVVQNRPGSRWVFHTAGRPCWCGGAVTSRKESFMSTRDA